VKREVSRSLFSNSMIPPNSSFVSQEFSISLKHHLFNIAVAATSYVYVSDHSRCPVEDSVHMYMWSGPRYSCF